jgi:hypothetical protein
LNKEEQMPRDTKENKKAENENSIPEQKSTTAVR